MRLATFTEINVIDTPLVEYRDEPKDSIRSRQADWEVIYKSLQLAIIPWGKHQFLIHPHKLSLLTYMLSAYLTANKRRSHEKLANH